ncbi:MAG: AMP-binding protein, partial [Armatimonadetes bacterium]|nr:AMP-binding protein [Akkermansiaceae bacterium]
GSVSSAWCLTIHHSIIDGNSFKPLFQRVRDHFEKKSAPLPDGSERPWEWLESSSDKEHLSGARYFAGLYSMADWVGNISSVFPPVERFENRIDASHHWRVPLKLNGYTVVLIDEFLRLRDVKLGTLIHATWSLILSRSTGSPFVQFGVTRHCRGKSGDPRAAGIGPFANTLPLLIHVNDEVSISEWLIGVRNSWLNLAEYESTPLALTQDSVISPTGSGLPFQTLVNVVVSSSQNEIAEILKGLIRATPECQQSTDFPLALTIHQTPEVSGYMVARKSDFSLNSTQRLVELFASVMVEIIGDVSKPVRELTLRKGRIFDSIDPVPTSASFRNLAQRLECACKQYPAACAISTPSQTITFSALWDAARSYASSLKSKGLLPQEIVSILTGRTPDTVAAMFGVLLAGGAFLIISELIPDHRKAGLMAQAGSRFYISDESLQLAAGFLHNDFQRIQAGPQSPAQDMEVSNIKPTNLAYVVATSGTTGTPKLVMIEHGAVTNMLDGYSEVLQQGQGDVRYQSASAGSDTFVLEVMLYLCSGSGLHLDAGLIKKGFAEFNQALEKYRITVLGLPSSVWKQWVRYCNLSGHDTPSHLRAVVCSMEKTDPLVLAQWRENAGKSLLWINAYGPSEASCVTTLFLLRPGDPTPESAIPIGTALPGTRVFVTDPLMRLLPHGFIGEIVIGGSGVGRGYLGDLQHTREKFISPPSGEGLLYRTGDQGYLDENGRLVFSGRIDNQVKIRGYRVELEEIELAIGQHSEVEDSAVVALEKGENRDLVAYYCSNRQIDSSEFRAFLSKNLPAAIIPRIYYRQNAIPRTDLGKIKRKVLTEDARNRFSRIKTSLVAPPSDMERPLDSVIVGIFQEILGIPEVGPDENFFTLGGDSLNAVRLQIQVETMTDFRITGSDLFRYPTPSSLAAHLATLKAFGKTRRCILSPLKIPDNYNQNTPVIVTVLLFALPLHSYHKLVESLDSSIGFYALEVSNLNEEGDVADIKKSILQSLVEALSGEEKPMGKIHLFGYSIDALLVWELASALNDNSAPCESVFLLEPSFQSERPYKRSNLPELVKKAWYRFRYSHSLEFSERFSLVSSAVIIKTRQLIDMKSAGKNAIHEVLIHNDSHSRIRNSFTSHLISKQDSVKVYLCRCRDGHHTSYLASYDAHWKELAAELEIVDLVGNHSELLQMPQVKILAKAFTKKLIS